MQHIQLAVSMLYKQYPTPASCPANSMAPTQAHLLHTWPATSPCCHLTLTLTCEAGSYVPTCWITQVQKGSDCLKLVVCLQQVQCMGGSAPCQQHSAVQCIPYQQRTAVQCISPAHTAVLNPLQRLRRLLPSRVSIPTSKSCNQQRQFDQPRTHRSTYEHCHPVCWNTLHFQSHIIQVLQVLQTRGKVCNAPKYSSCSTWLAACATTH